MSLCVGMGDTLVGKNLSRWRELGGGSGRNLSRWRELGKLLCSEKLNLHMQLDRGRGLLHSVNSGKCPPLEAVCLEGLCNCSMLSDESEARLAIPLRMS